MNVESTAASRQDITRYQGKRLLYLLAAMFVPAALLYLSIVFSLAASRPAEKFQQQIWMLRFALMSLAFFVPVQLAAAGYIQTILRRRASRIGKVLQYLAVLGLSLIISFIATLVLEAAGFNLLMRSRGLG